ncbi:MAG: hypothetical protein A3I61_12215 [Acidobacteria bacterium RIFCSPLOWO2_02_FULL_68_18]|nr:MAG: hypothetical protein A3I61_12215 [Acidobacteria bacterium RIFCSPLOWO2_02_FULL_68_18]
MSVGRLRIAAVALVVLAVPSVGRSQDSNSGTITGVVRDMSGSVLPGVTVEAASPALIEKVRVAATDGDGRFRIIDLRPGEYSVTFTLAGFRTLRREGIQLTTGFTATVNAELPVGGVEETITVSGAAPVVDVQGIQEQQVFSGETVLALPIGKNQGIYVTLIPAATQGTLANQDVGGTKGENTQTFAVHGGRATETYQLRDGVYFGEHIGNAANFAASVNPAIVQEVAVQTTGGLTAEAQSGGVIINVVSRDGGNEMHGVLSADMGFRDLQANNIGSDLRARGATLTGTLRHLYDVAFGVGGPLTRDRLWFYASVRKYESSNFQAGNYYNKSANPLFYERDLARPAYDRNLSQDLSVRLTWQAAQQHKITAGYRYEYNCNCNFGVATGQFSPEAAGNNWYPPLQSGQGSWSYPATNRLLFQAGGVFLGGTHRRKLGDEIKDHHIAVFDRLTNYWYGSPDRTLILFTQNLARTPRGQGNVSGTMSYVTGSHNFKVGALFLQSYRNLFQPFERAVSYTFAGRVPESVTYYAAPLNAQMRTRQIGLFVQEQWTLDRLTLYGGLRYDYDRGWNPAQDVPAGPYIGARRYDKVDNVPNWKDINPRVGFAYDLFGNGRTAIKANVGRFVAFEANGSLVFASNPANRIVTSATRVWTDANGDYVPQDSELGPLSNPNFGRPVTSTVYSDEVLHGWGNRGYNWQAALSFQHELVSGIGVNVGYYRTWYGNLTVTDNTLVSPADFDSYCITAPNNPRLPNAGERICGILEIKPAKFGQVSNVVNLANRYGDWTEVYDGIDVTLNARLGDGGLVGGGVATGRTRTDMCDILDDVPEFAITWTSNAAITSNNVNAPNNAPSRFCRVSPPWSALTQVKLFGTYPLPWDLRASFNYQHLPGVATTATYVVSGAEIATALGRAPAAGARATATVELLDPQELRREKRLNQVNLAVTRQFTVGGARLLPGIELHNAFNASTVHTMVTRYGPAWEGVRGVLTPRLVKVALQVDF